MLGSRGTVFEEGMVAKVREGSVVRRQAPRIATMYRGESTVKGTVAAALVEKTSDALKRV
jgi:hypothetical protein